MKRWKTILALAIVVLTIAAIFNAALGETPDNAGSGKIVEVPRHTSCEYDLILVNEFYDGDKEYVSINEEEHQESYTVVKREVYCCACGEALLTTTLNQPVVNVWEHDWSTYNWSTDEEIPYQVTCMDCGYVRKFEKLCDHGRTSIWEDGNLYCTECEIKTVLNSRQTYCSHTSFTVYEKGDSARDTYYQFDEKIHLKYTLELIYDDDERYAECNACDMPLEVVNGRITGVGYTDFNYDSIEYSDLETHTFENGICKFCGYKSETVIAQPSGINLTLNIANAEIRDGVALMNDVDYAIRWYADGNVESYSIYLYDGNNNLLNKAEGIPNTEIHLSGSGMNPGEIYTFRVGAMPAGGNPDEIVWKELRLKHADK